MTAGRQPHALVTSHRRFSLIPIGGAIILVGVAVLCLLGDDPTGRWWALPMLLGAAWIARWHVRRRRRAVSLRVDDDGGLFVRDAEGERPLAWNHVTRIQVRLTTSLYVAVIGIAATLAPFRVMMEQTSGSPLRLLSIFVLCGGLAALCGAETYGRLFRQRVSLRPSRWNVWFSRTELDALIEEARSRARVAPP